MAVVRYARTLSEAHAASLRLYRSWLRSSEKIHAQSYLDIPLHVLRARIRREFEGHRSSSDLATINVAIARGHMELEETLKLWKQKTHIMRYFDRDERAAEPNKAFMDRFLDGVGA